MGVSSNLYIVVSTNFVFWLILSAILIKRTYLALAIAPLLISLALRVLSVSYIDLFGPVYSSQLLKTLGPGIDSLYMILCYTSFLVPFLLILEISFFRSAKNLTMMGDTYSRRYTAALFYLFLFGFLTALYMQLFMGEVIPLFDRIERYDYC